MFVHRIVTILAVVASAAATLHAQDLIRNGGFTQSAPRSGDGSIPPNQVAGWSAAYGTPQIIAGEGCRDPGSIALWGNKVAGEAIAQPVSLKKGVTYDISLCARYRGGPMPDTHVDLRLSTAPLRGPLCPARVCESVPVARSVTATAFKRYHFQFTAPRNYCYVTLSASNDGSAGGAPVSWAEVDDLSIIATGLVSIVNAGARSAVPDQYVVWFKAGTPLADVTAAELNVEAAGGTIFFRYRYALLGFGAELPPPALQIARLIPGAIIEVNQILHGDYDTQLNPPTGLDRTDQRSFGGPTPHQYTYSETGAGVHVYVLDSGIMTKHVDFESRAFGEFTAIKDRKGTNDAHGHGTHVAGIIGGKKYGIAKKVTLHAVRVLDRNREGPLTGVIAGVDWVTAHRIKPAVANMSLSGDTVMPSLDEAVTNSIASGITYVISAGNAMDDACKYSPQRVPEAITVGAVNPANDKRFPLSNFGPCLDLFAPGAGIESAGIENNKASAVMSGTSMATPHVTGVAALYLQLHPDATPAEVWGAVGGIRDNADVLTTPNWFGIVNLPPGTPNVLLHWGALGNGYDDVGSASLRVAPPPDAPAPRPPIRRRTAPPSCL